MIRLICGLICVTEISSLLYNNTFLPETEIQPIFLQPKDTAILPESTKTSPEIPVITSNRPLRNRKRKNKNTNINTIESNSLNLNNTIGRQKKIQKSRRKKKLKYQDQGDILEVTKARNKFNNTLNVYNDTKIIALINQLNRDPELLNNTITERKQKRRRKKKRRNRCLKNNGGCMQLCNRKGKRKCSCLEGYTLASDKKKCIDIDECKLANGGCKEVCINSPGSYHCECSKGFRVAEDSRSCQDINECHLRNGHGLCQDTCINTHGSYICACSNLNGTRLADDKHTCQDIDECAEGAFGCSHKCINTGRGAFCSCPEGFLLGEDYKTCEDVDECKLEETCPQSCINTVGSYFCQNEIQNDEANVKKATCPKLPIPSIGFIACPRDIFTPFDSYSKTGRKRITNSPGTRCNLICPEGYILQGNGLFVCDISGRWSSQKMACSKAASPSLSCPKDLTFFNKEKMEKVMVKFPAPKTKLKWSFVKSYPEWAKNLEGMLGDGQHKILFLVTDPVTGLSANCSFSIIIK